MSAQWEHIRDQAARTRARYAIELGGDAPFPLAVDDLAERVYQLSAFPDPTLPPEINGELNPVLQSIRLHPAMDAQRQRFIIAHELGHYVLEGAATVFQDNDATLDERASGGDDTEHGVLRVYNTREHQEQDANLYALELLIPADVLWHLVQQPGWTVEQIAQAFDVSLDAARTQLINVCCVEPVRMDAVDQVGLAALAPDAEQQAAVDAPLPTLVVAGPGTGKTRSIVAKYVALVESGVDPAKILALTFSNKAAEEMRVRITTALQHMHPDIVGRVEVSTFHAWGLNFLKSYGPHVGLPLDLHLRATGDLFVLLRRRLADLPLGAYKMLHDPAYYLRDIMGAISRAKDELRTPAEYRVLAHAEADRLIAAAAAETAGKTSAKAEETRQKAAKQAARLRELTAIYEHYEALLRAEGAVDYGDLIMHSVAALRIPDVARELQAKYYAILVDEFQDINYASGTLVALLDGGRGVVWAVGDPWQSIYRFRGASAANLAEFASMYPAATTTSLVRNYRSVQAVLDASHAVMGTDPLATTRGVQQAQRCGEQQPVVQEWEVVDQATEYAAIAHDILQRVGGKYYRTMRCAHRRLRTVRRIKASLVMRRRRRARFADHAVLCRKHAQVVELVKVLEAHGVPVDGGGALLDYGEVKDALAICAITRSMNDVGLLRALTLPEYKLSTDDLELLVRNAHAERRSLQRAMRDDTIVCDLSEHGQAMLERLRDLHDELAGEHDAWRVLARYLFDMSTTMRDRIVRAAGGDAHARRELANIGQLLLLARTFARQALPGERGAAQFIAYVRVLIEAGEAPKAAPLVDGTDAVRVMTIHAAKGLEFPTVYVPGLQKDVFPPRNQGSVIPPIGGLVHGPLSDEQTEERYLLYVAMTRARDRLVLSRAAIKGDKAVARSILLPTNAPWPVRTVEEHRPCAQRPNQMRLRSAPVQVAMVAATSIDTYDTCPRRYLYQYGYQLFDDAAPFLRMHHTIKHVINELAEAAQAHALPSDDMALERLVRHAFRRHDLHEVVYHEDYLDEVLRHVRQVWHDLRTGTITAQAMNQRMVVARPAGQVAVRVDRVEDTANGTRYVYYKSGRPRDDDHRSTRMILYTLAAQTQQPDAEVAIYYTATHETRVIEHRASTLSTHTGKIDNWLAGIAAEAWEPKAGEQCTTCPFNLICPV